MGDSAAGAEQQPQGRLQAEPDWRCIDLLSDVHLHPAMPRTAEAFARHLRQTPADAVLMLGDLFEVWVGDDARHDAFEAAVCAQLREAARTRWLGFLPGNRDFLLGQAMAQDTGLHRLADPCLLQAFGQPWLLSHGDALCLADLAYQRFRAQVRDPAWQAALLARPIAERRALARQMRDASQAYQAGQADQPGGRAPALSDDGVDDAAACRWLLQHGAPVLIHGHTHQPASRPLADGLRREVLGDWDFDHAITPRAEILRLTPAGLQRLDLAAAGP